MVAGKNSLNKDKTKEAVDAVALAVDNSGMREFGDTAYFGTCLSTSENGIGSI